MSVVKVGAEYRFTSDWGIKGAVGVSVPGFTTVGYQLTGVYHVSNPDSRFQVDLEAGLPIAYFNVLEGVVVDWDPTVDDPFAGWTPGVSVSWGDRQDHPVIPALALQLALPAGSKGGQPRRAATAPQAVSPSDPRQ